MSALQNPFSSSVAWTAQPNVGNSGRQNPDLIDQLYQTEVLDREWVRWTLEQKARTAIQPDVVYFVAHYVSAEPAIQGPAGNESQEMEWLVTNSEMLSRYAGQWLLISGNELITHTRNIREIRQIVRERGIVSPFIYYVPTNEESNSVTL